MDEMMILADQLSVRVVEDAAHAFPTTYQGKTIGSIGDFTVFSFYATKTLTTGEGGMVTTSDTDAVARMKVMRLHGIDRDAWDRYNRLAADWYYEIVAPGFKYNMPDTAAAIGLHQLRRSDEMWTRRTQIAERYRSAFVGTRLRPLDVRQPGDKHAWHLFVIRLAEDQFGPSRDSFIKTLASSGIGTSVHFIPLHRMPYYRDIYRLKNADFPGAEEYFRTCISLPIYSSLSEANVTRVIAACRQGAVLR